MRLGRRKSRPTTTALVLPGPSDSVVIGVPRGGHMPARVLERGPDTLLLAITVPTRPLTPAQLQDLVVEYNSARGRVRLHGAFAVEDPAEPDVVRMRQPRSVEVLQERDYVRIRAGRPVIVYRGSDHGRIESFTVDVSGGGLLLAGPDTLAVGEQMTFRLSLAAGEPPVAGTGQVVRVDAVGRRAIAFTEISDLDRRRLVRFIFECQRAERRRGLSDGSGDGGR